MKKEIESKIEMIDKSFKIVLLIGVIILMQLLIFIRSFKAIYLAPFLIIVVAYSSFNIYRGIKFKEIILPKFGLVNREQKLAYFQLGLTMHVLSVLICGGVSIWLLIF